MRNDGFNKYEYLLTVPGLAEMSRRINDLSFKKERRERLPEHVPRISPMIYVFYHPKSWIEPREGGHRH